MTPETKLTPSEEKKENKAPAKPLERPDIKSLGRLFMFFALYLLFRICAEYMFMLASAAAGASLPEVIRSFIIAEDIEGNLGFTNDWLVIISGVGFAAAGFMILGKAREYDHKYSQKKDISAGFIALIIAGSVLLAVLLNLLISFSGIAGLSQSYAETAEKQYSCSFAVGLIVYGFITPFSEELMFRGILYNGFKRYFQLRAAVIMCAAIFAIYHANSVQGIYSFVMALFIIYAYERSGRLYIPIAVHMIANLSAYILTFVSGAKI